MKHIIYELKNAPTADRYVSGLSALEKKVTEKHMMFFRTHYSAELHTATAGHIASLTNVRWTTVNYYYGKLGRTFCEVNDLVPEIWPDAEHYWWSVWARGWYTPAGFVWQMLPQVVEALERLNWVIPGSSLSLPDEVIDSSNLVEGAAHRINVNAYERNAQARKKCIDHYGSRCFICGFDFESVYGPTACGYIHVHHMRPISTIGKSYVINPVDDLRPVCPNCHAVLHLGGQNRTPEQVRQLIQKH